MPINAKKSSLFFHFILCSWPSLLLRSFVLVIISYAFDILVFFWCSSKLGCEFYMYLFFTMFNVCGKFLSKREIFIRKNGNATWYEIFGVYFGFWGNFWWKKLGQQEVLLFAMQPKINAHLRSYFEENSWILKLRSFLGQRKFFEWVFFLEKALWVNYA